MTEITVGKNFIEARGHSGYAEKGSDIVCAAVSALIYALAYNLELADRRWKIRPEAEFKEGCCRVSCDPKGRGKVKAAEMLKFTENGLKLIAENYPQNVITAANG